MYVIYDSTSGKISEHSSLESLLENFASSNLASLYYWTLGLEDWLPFEQVLTKRIIEKKKYQFPSLPALQKAPTTATAEPTAATAAFQPTNQIVAIQEAEFVAEEVTQKIQISNLKPNEFRKSPRYDLRIKVILSNKEKTFLSYTQNISVTGVLLEDVIPVDFFQNEESEIFVSSPKKNEFLAFRCRPVGDQSSPRRFSFGQISSEALTKFQDWIDRLRKDS